MNTMRHNGFITRKEINMNWLKSLWHEFEDTPVIINDDGDTVIDADFYIWEKGTSREDIWHWFDERCENGLAKDLM